MVSGAVGEPAADSTKTFVDGVFWGTERSIQAPPDPAFQVRESCRAADHRRLARRPCVILKDSSTKRPPEASQLTVDQPISVDKWLRDNAITEVEAMIADMNGIARGKIANGQR